METFITVIRFVVVVFVFLAVATLVRLLIDWIFHQVARWVCGLFSPQGSGSPDLPQEFHKTLRETREACDRALEQRDAALTRLAELEAERGGGAEASGKIAAAKRAFARLYHPDNMKVDGIERTVRTEIFKEFWVELEKIEKPPEANLSTQ